VNKFWNIGVIEDVDRDENALLESQQRSGGGSVVTYGRNLDAAGELQLERCDTQLVVRWIKLLRRIKRAMRSSASCC
jgi:hypothetical protein